MLVLFQFNGEVLSIYASNEETWLDFEFVVFLWFNLHKLALNLYRFFIVWFMLDLDLSWRRSRS